MSATGGGGEAEGGESASDHAYFQAVEEAFVRLRGAPLLLSPSDWQIARRWHREGIPLDLVISTLEQIFAQRREREAQGAVLGKVGSLRYCASAVEAAWRSVRELAAAGERQAAPQIDVAARLSALAAALPATLPGREPLATAIRALTGTPSAVEDALAELDEETLAAAESRLAAVKRKEIEAETEAALSRLGGRLGGEEAAAAGERLLRRSLRRRLGLPLLSLFATEAERGDDGPASE